ncbi:MAG: DNA-binding protein WhiA [Clostridia bacterium]|nr:DNA-binding protein WhiA [Clostridia bacterium]
MSFTTDVKKEIISRGLGDDEQRGAAEKKSGLSAFVRTSGNFGVTDGSPNFFLVSETENVAEFFMSVFSETLGFELFISHATMDKMSGRDKLLLQCPASRASEALQALGLLKRSGDFREGIAASLIGTESRKIAYIQGAFLGGGSCTLPGDGAKTGYHLEIVFPQRKLARDFCALLDEFELIAKLTERKETSVVYIKSKEMISDFLAIVGAENSLRKFSQLVEKRDEANRNNRAQNCLASNADKAAIASVKQVVAIQKLIEKGELNDLSEELQRLAKARIEHRLMSMQELADYLKVSKSCLNHRMRRLLEMAEHIESDKNKKTDE